MARHYRSGFDKVLLDDRYEALRKLLERKHGTTDIDLLRTRMLAEKIVEDPLLHQSLQVRFPGESSAQLADRVLQRRYR